MTEKTEYPEVRELTRADRKKLSELIKLFAERSGNTKLLEMLPGRNGEDKKKAGKAEKSDEPAMDKTYELVKSVMDNLLGWVEEELSDWFMNLIAYTNREEYDALPFDIEVYIIDQIVAQEGFNNFFSRAWGLYKKIPG